MCGFVRMLIINCVREAKIIGDRLKAEAFPRSIAARRLYQGVPIDFTAEIGRSE
jgi:hypothetical protein